MSDFDIQTIPLSPMRFKRCGECGCASHLGANNSGHATNCSKYDHSKNDSSTGLEWISIPLTAARADIWDWAQDAMNDYWTQDNDARGDDIRFDESPIKPAKDGVGKILNHPEVIDDMIYRFEEQLESMAAREGGFGGRWDSSRMEALRSVQASRWIVSQLRKAVQQ